MTGGAGFIGSNLVRKLSKEGADITVLDDLFTGDVKLIEDIPAVTFVKGCVTDEMLIDELVANSNIVFNLAARNIIVSTRNPQEDFKVNTGGMLNILLAAKKHGIERVVYTSSASVYGNSRYLPINEDDQLNGQSITKKFFKHKTRSEHHYSKC